MIELTADRTVCIGSGMCVLTAPEIFDQSDDDGLVTLDATDQPDADQAHLSVPEDRAEQVRQAVQTCPSGALSLRDGT